MQRRIKIILLIVAIIITSCSVKKRLSTVDKSPALTLIEIGQLTDEVRKSNIYHDGFIIKKGRIKTEGLEINGNYSFSGKFANDGDFILSIKGPLALELVRIVSIDDLVYVINRIERVIYNGSMDAFLKRYNIPDGSLEIIFGDLPLTVNTENGFKDLNDDVYFYKRDEPYIEEFAVSKREKKVKCVILKSDDEEDIYSVKFNEYRKAGSKTYPFEIEMKDHKRGIKFYLFLEEFTDKCEEDIIINMPDYRKKPL